MFWQRGYFNELPLAKADGSAKHFDIDQNIVMRRWLAFCDGRDDIFSIEGKFLAALTTDHCQNGRHEIDMVQRLVNDGGTQSCGPVDNRRHSDPAFFQAALATAKRQVGTRWLASDFLGVVRASCSGCEQGRVWSAII